MTDSPAVPSVMLNMNLIQGKSENQACYCTRCKQMVPTSMFYPSSLRRGVYYCKTCCRSKRTTAGASELLQSSDSAINLKRVHARQSDAATIMLNRLRRMCSKPQNCGFKHILPYSIAIGFGVRQSRTMLAAWKNQSAVPSETLALMSSRSSCAGSDRLRWIPWKKTNNQPLQPWEVVPLTRTQAFQLSKIPPHLWSECLPAILIHEIEAKLATIQEIIVKSILQPAVNCMIAASASTSGIRNRNIDSNCILDSSNCVEGTE